jgi:uncharacterized membrane-anchored protein YhcB (DUF1043 family)
MWPAFVIALLIGLLAGYLLGKKMSTGANTVLQQQVEALQLDLDEAKNKQKLLEQETADLKYLLGEEKKARAYAEQRN